MEFQVYGSSEKAAIVLDIGEGWIRAGFAGEGKPRHCEKSCVGHILKRTEYEPRDVALQSVKAAMKRQLERLFMFKLQASAKERRVVLCENFTLPLLIRRALVSIFFEDFETPSIMFGLSAAFAFYPTQTTTGLVIQIGQSEVRVCPVYEGAAITTAYACAAVGGSSVARRLRNLLVHQEPNPVAENLLSEDGLEDIKTKLCFARSSKTPAAADVKVSLCPDKCGAPVEVVISGETRAAAADALFDNKDDCGSLTTALMECLLQCPRDMRTVLVQNVILVGGGAMIPGIKARIREEFRKTLEGGKVDTSAGADAGDTLKKNQASQPQLGPNLADWLVYRETQFRADQLPWVGASIIGALDMLAEKSVTIEKYKAEGWACVGDWTVLSGPKYEEYSQWYEEHGLR